MKRLLIDRAAVNRRGRILKLVPRGIRCQLHLLPNGLTYSDYVTHSCSRFCALRQTLIEIALRETLFGAEIGSHMDNLF